MRHLSLVLIVVPVLLMSLATSPAPAAAPARTPAAPTTPAAPAAAGSAADVSGAPTMDQLIDLMAQQKYQDALRGISKCLALRGAASQPYNRADLLMLRGEAYLHTRQNAQAADSFAQAAKATDDKDQKALAQATEVLIKRSKPTGYVPRTPSTQPGVTPGTPLPIVDKDQRKAAFSALLDDELAVASPKVKAATSANSLNPVIEAAKSMSDLRAIEIAAGSGDAKTKSIGERLGQHAHTLIKGSLDQMKTRVEAISDSANKSSTLNEDPGSRYRMSGSRGLTSVESDELKNMIALCDKIAPTASELATVVGGTELNDDAGQAQDILKRAREVLQTDYSGSGGPIHRNQQPYQPQQPQPQQPRKSN